MADPFFSTATSIVGIINLLARTTSRLGELKERWRQADFVFINLIAQLSALKAALNKLQGWMDVEVDEAHHLLVMDLEASITCCQMLVNRINSEIQDLHESAENGLSSQSRLKLIFRNGTLEELQKMVERQTNALTLLLMVCNW
jgi:guanine nucleotide-binding protein G(i) subunit alpha